MHLLPYPHHLPLSVTNPSLYTDTLHSTALSFHFTIILFEFLHSKVSLLIASLSFSLKRNFKNSFIKMNTTKIFITTCTTLFICCTLAYAQPGYGATTLGSGYGASILALSTPTILTPNTTPAPAPAPAPVPPPEYINLTDLLINLNDLLADAGPFSTFLKYLESTKLIETLQIQANHTEEGITLFVPKDSAFSNLKKPSLSNLTSNQLKQLCLFHALPHFYSLPDFKNISGGGPVNTLAGGSYTLNFTDEFGTIHIGSGWTNIVVSSITGFLLVDDHVAIYPVNRVLLPEAIFGTNIPPPAPAPAPVTDGWIGGVGPEVFPPGTSCRIVGWRWVLMVGVSGGLMVVM